MYITSKYKKRWPTSFIVGEIQVKTTQIAVCVPFEQLTFVSVTTDHKLWLKMTEIYSLPV